MVDAEHDAAGEDRGEQKPVDDVLSRELDRAVPGRIAWSFPKAMFDPQNETEPITVENRPGR